MTIDGMDAELWKTICERAASEEDPERLLELANEIDHLLGQKMDRLHQAEKKFDWHSF